VPNLIFAIEKLKDLGFWIYASNLNIEAQAVNEVQFAKKTALIIGNEQKGVSHLVTKKSDLNVYLPSSKIIDSYNASVAAGILMFVISSQLRLV
jgi:23S rRNA (guanosine2251-2'-O)-methyltransferase